MTKSKWNYCCRGSCPNRCRHWFWFIETKYWPRTRVSFAPRNWMLFWRNTFPTPKTSLFLPHPPRSHLVRSRDWFLLRQLVRGTTTCSDNCRYLTLNADNCTYFDNEEDNTAIMNKRTQALILGTSEDSTKWDPPRCTRGPRSDVTHILHNLKVWLKGVSPEQCLFAMNIHKNPTTEFKLSSQRTFP